LIIAITADPTIPVPPQNYGGIERIIDFLVTGLIKKDHEVILVAHKESQINSRLIPYSCTDQNMLAQLKNMITVAQLRNFNPDIIHSFSRVAYLLPFFRSKTPKIMSYQRKPTIAQIKKALHIVKSDSLSFTGCSDYITNQIRPFAKANTVYNGVDLNLYQPNLKVEEHSPLIFLGRIEPIKGTHIAVEIAIQTNRKLIIAGNIPQEQLPYFNSEIAPFLSDQIIYVGEVNDIQKNELLRTAAALLMPIQWNEPFGIVMTEAMACGTPVIAFNRGSVPEIVINESNGFVCSTIAEMILAVNKIDRIDRSFVRKDCEERFSAEVIVANYIAIYNSLINMSSM